MTYINGLLLPSVALRRIDNEHPKNLPPRNGTGADQPNTTFRRIAERPPSNVDSLQTPKEAPYPDRS